MNKQIFSMDWKDFDKKFPAVVKKAVPELSAKGLRLGLQELKLDADNVPPRTPHKEGHLRGSGKVHNIKAIGQEISGELTFGGVEYDVLYAARLHEAELGTINWSEPDVGPKYLESKLIRFMKKYMAIVAAVIKGGAK